MLPLVLVEGWHWYCLGLVQAEQALAEQALQPAELVVTQPEALRPAAAQLPVRTVGVQLPVQVVGVQLPVRVVGVQGEQ